MKIKYLPFMILSFGLLSCSQKSEPNFSVMCEDLIKDIHLTFNFKDQEVDVRFVPKEFFRDAMRETSPQFKEDNGEQTFKHQITEHTGSYIKYVANPANIGEVTMKMDFTFNRVNMNLTTVTGFYNEDGSLGESPFEAVKQNPVSLQQSCKKPIT
tara:strand:- start:262 stop:726 length:465 start_codon:yes stop_codon:yes gene_type:complete